MAKEITLTKDGGFFYRSMTFHYVTTGLILPFLCVAVLVAILNPFWFRNDFFNFIERKVNDITRWRNNIKYRIYLGCDPKVWHSLKD